MSHVQFKIKALFRNLKNSFAASIRGYESQRKIIQNLFALVAIGYHSLPDNETRCYEDNEKNYETLLIFEWLISTDLSTIESPELGLKNVILLALNKVMKKNEIFKMLEYHWSLYKNDMIFNTKLSKVSKYRAFRLLICKIHGMTSVNFFGHGKKYLKISPAVNE